MELVLMLSRIFLHPLSTPLLNIFILSLEKGIFSDEFKIATVTPIYKSGDENNFENYRPIFVLPCFSETLEIIMYKRLIEKPHIISETIWFSKESFTRTCYNTTAFKLED